jgi:hypothetical protein
VIGRPESPYEQIALSWKFSDARGAGQPAERAAQAHGWFFFLHRRGIIGSQLLRMKDKLKTIMSHPADGDLCGLAATIHLSPIVGKHDQGAGCSRPLMLSCRRLQSHHH